MHLANKVVVVTGAGSGMGREITREALRRRARVAAVDINPTTLAETAMLAKGRGDALETFVVDITDRDAVEALPGRVVERFGSVDGVVNCAGIIQPFVRLADLDYAAIDRVFAVNWHGTLYMTKAFLPHLLERPVAHIANISSMGGLLPFPGQTVYGASKAAVKLLTEGLHAELAGTNVHVTVVFPGAIATNISVNSGVDIPMAGGGGGRQASTLPADKAARQILDGIERDRFHVLVGRDVQMLDKFYRVHPRRATAFIAGQMKGMLPD